MGLISRTYLNSAHSGVKAFFFNVFTQIVPPVNYYSPFFPFSVFFFVFHLAEKTALISGCKKI